MPVWMADDWGVDQFYRAETESDEHSRMQKCFRCSTDLERHSFLGEPLRPGAYSPSRKRNFCRGRRSEPDLNALKRYPRKLPADGQVTDSKLVAGTGI
jgi:hypothetical protein